MTAMHMKAERSTHVLNSPTLPVLVMICSLVIGTVYTHTLHARQDTVRVVPLGNSITQGTNTYATYRRPLWHMLDSAGHCVDFVGTENTPHYSARVATAYDPDHEGHWGWRTEHVIEQLPVWLEEYTPDIALVHLGTNDLVVGDPIDTVCHEYSRLVEVLRADNPAVIVLLAGIIPGTGEWFNRRVDSLCNAVDSLAPVLSTAQSPVLAVDMREGFDTATDLYDEYHPDSSGEEHMARRWFAPLDSILRGPVLVRAYIDAAHDRAPILRNNAAGRQRPAIDLLGRAVQTPRGPSGIFIHSLHGKADKRAVIGDSRSDPARMRQGRKE